MFSYHKGIKFRGYLILRLEQSYTLPAFNFAIWRLQNISRVSNLAISVKIMVSLMNIAFSIFNQCNCYQICCRNSNYYQQKDVIYVYPYNAKIKYQEKESFKLCRYSISRFCGFEIFRGYKIWRKRSENLKITTINTSQI